MQFKEWLEKDLLNEMPAIRLNGPQRMVVLNGENGYLHSELITADLIDLRFEDWKSYGRNPPLGLKRFAAPLADGQWLNVDMPSPIGGSGTIDSEKHAAIDQSLQAKPYPELPSDWASFGEFLNGSQVVKPAPGEASRIQARTSAS